MRIPVLVLLLVASSPSALAQTVFVQLPAGFRVELAPPRLRVEAPPPAPSPSQAWVPGYWSFANGNYVWVAGAYVAAPQPGARWAAARWVNRDGAWYFEPGRWLTGGVVTAPPPAYQPPPPGYQQQPPPYQPPPPAYQPPPPPPRQPPPPRRLSREEAEQRAYQIASSHGLQPQRVQEAEPDDGAWKVKLILAGGGKAKIEIDPWSGAELRFKVDGQCRPNQYWDGDECRHKGKGHGARKHDRDD
ncbi:MAG: hypothetical protein WCC48_18205 [Anaeromyxobacteraceae bacterium]